MELLKEKKGHFLYIPFFLFFTIYYVLSQCIVYWIHFQNTRTFIYQKTLHTSYTFLIVLKIVKSQKCILKNKYTFTSKTLFRIYYQTIIIISINQNNIFLNILYIYTAQWGWRGPIFGIFHDLVTHSNHSTIWHQARIYDIVSWLFWLEKHLIFDLSCF